MNKINLLLIAALFPILAATSCKKDEPEEPEIPNEEEVITTLNMTLTPAGGGTAVVLSFQDLDGDGGEAPIISEGTLDANTIYDGSLELLNEAESPVEDITEEVQEEGAEHQFFFESTVAGLDIAYDDSDANGDPVGLETVVTTTDPGTGTITVVLRHEPNKGADGVADGDITNAGGETDIEVTFTVTVE